MPENTIDHIDRLIIKATQAGLPVTERPYQEIAMLAGLNEETVMNRIKKMQANKIIRRIGVVPNHYRLGYRSNGMSVWDVPDDKVCESGEIIGSLEFVSHCYHRPRHLPDWPYNLFAMVHGRDRSTTEKHVNTIAELLGDVVRSHDVLYSTRILKKTGMRI